MLIWSLGSPLSQVMILSTFSRMLGARPQGLMMGLITGAGSVGRIVSPLIAVSLPIALTFGLVGSASLLCALLLLAYYLLLRCFAPRDTVIDAIA
jgi:MFS transporter, ceroid-lipofuscinosis neuronal protein 7